MGNEFPRAHGLPFDREAFVRAVGACCAHDLQLLPSAKILVAVSGGADSIALYYVLRELGYSVAVAHFDHMTRDGASTQDAAFVQTVAAKDGVPCHTQRTDVSGAAKASGESFEMHARRLRYAFLVRTALARGCSHIATGHHADDQAETVLMRVIRGTTGAGLAGIPAVREVQGVRIVRPLLGSRRSQILAYLQTIGAEYREDVTNCDVEFVRNRVRHSLIPELEREYNSQVVAALCRLADNQRVENAWLDAEVTRATSTAIQQGAINRNAFAALPAAFQRHVFQNFAWGLGVDCGYERVVAGVSFVIEGRSGARFDLGGGIVLINGATVTEVASGASDDGPDEIGLAVPGATVAFNRTFTVRTGEPVPPGRLADYCTPSRQVFDAVTIRDLAVRRVRAGDRFTPLGMLGSRKLSDYMGELKLSPSERAAQWVLTSGGRIVWVVGRAMSADAAVSVDTRSVVEVEVTDADL